MHWPLRAPPVQPLAQRVPDHQVKHDDDLHADDEVDAGQLVVHRVGDERERARQAQPRIQDPAELIRAGAEEPPLVPAEDADRDHPQQRQRQAEKQVPVVGMRTEAHPDRGDRRHDRRGEISDRNLSDVGSHPGVRPARQPVGMITYSSNRRIGHTTPHPSMCHGRLPPGTITRYSTRFAGVLPSPV